MKKFTLALVVAAMVFGGTAYVAVGGTPKAEDGMIVGVVIDIVDYGMHGRIGEEHVESGTYRAEHGFPIGILEDETGKVYVAVYRLPVPAAGLQTANKVLVPFMGKKIVAQGLIYRAQGVNVVRLALAKEY